MKVEYQILFFNKMTPENILVTMEVYSLFTPTFNNESLKAVRTPLTSSNTI